MGTVRQLATEIERGLREARPHLRKTVVTRVVALAVGAMLEAQTPNKVELANLLLLPTERQDLREQWLRRLLKNPLRSSAEGLEPWARQALAGARPARATGGPQDGPNRLGRPLCDLDGQPRGGRSGLTAGVGGGSRPGPSGI